MRRVFSSSLLALVILSTCTAFAIPLNAYASHAWFWHWKKNVNGGYERWIPYHDFTNSSIYPSSVGVNHNMAHYYYADNYAKPYKVAASNAAKIDFFSGEYYAPWYGVTSAKRTNGSHFEYVEVLFDEADGLSGSRKHSVICHEAGHALGLDHQSSTTSCMWPDETRWPTDANTHDHAMLKSIYKHTNE